MHARAIRYRNGFLLSSIPLLLCACVEIQQERPIVFAGIAPQAWLVEQLAGDLVQVEILLPPAAGHTTYSPAPSQIRALSHAALFVRSGLPFEERMWEQVARLNPDAAVVNAPSTEEDAHEGHAHDPHFWADPILFQTQAETVKTELLALLPEHADAIEANARSLKTRLTKIDKEIGTILAEHNGKTFWTFHGSWGHFAERYGLEQKAIEFEGKEAGVQSFMAVVAELEKSRAAIVFVEPGTDPQRLEVFRTDTGVELKVLDAMRQDYDTGLLEAAKAIAGAFE